MFLVMNFTLFTPITAVSLFIVPLHSITGRDTNVLVYIKRRLAMCARKLQKIKEAVKIMKDVSNIDFLTQTIKLLRLKQLNILAKY